MPVHDWTRVEDGIFHAFHFEWLAEISNALNGGILPKEYYALTEFRTGEYESAFLAMKIPDSCERHENDPQEENSQGAKLTGPRIAPTAEADFFNPKQNMITVRHISNDEVVAVVEIVTPENKRGRLRLDRFVEKTVGLFSRQIHMLLIDIFPPGPRDPRGIHAEIWEVAGGSYALPYGNPLMQVAYEANELVSAYVVPLAVGDSLTEMPLFLKPQGCVHIPLEQTYQAAFDVQPRRWKDFLERR